MNESTSRRGCGPQAWCLAAALLALASSGGALAQGSAPVAKAASAPANALPTQFDRLTGAWVRPDGGYVIVIKSVGPGGELQASYFNPSPLPFSKAQASREGAVLRAQFELRAGGYNGSTYELRYDPATDRLVGTYYQAVAKQTFEVQFNRK